jgi:diguanylate cyclase (GGDEF)-like protein
VTALTIALTDAVAGADPPPWAHGGQGNGQGNDGGSAGTSPAPQQTAAPPTGNNPGHGGTAPGQQQSNGDPSQSSSSNSQGGDGGQGNGNGNGGNPPGQSGNNPGHGGAPPGQAKKSKGTRQTGTTSTPTNVATTTQTPVSTPVRTPPLSTRRSRPTTPGATSPGPGIVLTSLAIRGSHGPSRSTAGTGGVLGAAAGGVFAGNPLATPLAPGTAGVGRTPAGTTTFSHPGQQERTIVVPPSSSPTTVISRFISRIPLAVWIVLAAALALAAAAGAAAFAFGRRARSRAGEVAVVTAAATTDPLTGVFNRRGFNESAERELRRARRYGHEMALAWVDIRGLKAVNDSEGHAAGDRLIQQVAVLLSQSARAHDLVGRMGGDELAVLLAEQSAAGADAMSRRFREQVPQHRAALGLTTAWDVTIGTASFPEDGDTLDELLKAADRRMYQQRGIRLRAS